MSKSNFYRETIPKIIEKYKIAVKQCLDVIEKDFEEDELTSDKLHNVLKAKKMASEDVIYYAKQIEALENEMNGVVETKEVKKTGAESLAVQ